MAGSQGEHWIRESIAQILRDWDPIGVRDIPEAQDEYDGYVGGVYRLLNQGISVGALADYLLEIQTESLGLEPVGREKLIAIAERLLALDVRF
jgi:hypothetical protein